MKQLSGVDVSFLNMETQLGLRPCRVGDDLRPRGRARRRRRRGDQAGDPRTHRPAGTVPAATRRGAARPRPAVLDRGPRLRHRLPRPPPRRAGAGDPRAARRGRLPDPRPPARPVAAAVGAVRHRGRRRRDPHRPADEGAPRHDRRCVGRADARRHPRHRTRRPPDRRAGSVVARPGADRPGAAPAHARAVPAQPGEVRPPVRAHAARAERGDRERRAARASPTSSPSRSPGRSATCCASASRGSSNEVDDPPALPADGGPADAVERDDHAAPALRLHDHPARGRQEDPPGSWLHVQRRRDGAVLGHAAAVPDRARRAPRREPDRRRAGERPHRRRGGHVPEPGVDAARRPGDERARPGGPACGACSRA